MEKRNDAGDLMLPRLIQKEPERGMLLVIQRYGRPVQTICRNILSDGTKEDVEDAVSECFAAIWQAAARFDPDQGASFRSYCYGIARITALARRRKLKLPPVLPLDELCLADGDYADEVSRFEDEQLVHEAVDRMREPERSIFILRYFYFFKVKEIAERMDMPAKKVENILSRRKKELEMLLLEGGIGYAENG